MVKGIIDFNFNVDDNAFFVELVLVEMPVLWDLDVNDSSLWMR